MAETMIKLSVHKNHVKEYLKQQAENIFAELEAYQRIGITEKLHFEFKPSVYTNFKRKFITDNQNNTKEK